MAAARTKGLGKGLEALFGDVEIKRTETTEGQNGESEKPEGSVSFVDINNIKPNASQPRQIFDDEKIEELAASIAFHGVIQPIVLKKSSEGFELVAGERRWRAARKAGLKQIPAIVRELTKEQLMMVALIENIQREDLNPMEEAETFRKICSEFGLSQEDLSKSVGKSRPYITNSLRLLKLPAEIQAMVLGGRLTNGHARTLISVEDPEKQIKMAEKVAQDGLSVRETEKLVLDQERKIKKGAKKALEKQTDIKTIEEELKEILGTKVTLRHKGRSGKIEIGYFSRDELERLIEAFRTLRS